MCENSTAQGIPAARDAGEYELIERPRGKNSEADFCITLSEDCMRPYIEPGQTVYVQASVPLEEFDAGIFYLNGRIFCRQWCEDCMGTLHLLAADPSRADANISVPAKDRGKCLCLGRVMLEGHLPRPAYY
ncbi:MAG: S24 family peptidase [Candidatus Limivicinus sp.]